MGTFHKSMLVLTLALLICEVVFSRVCNTLINMVDGFHTLFVLMHIALPLSQATSSSDGTAKDSHKFTQVNSSELSPSTSHSIPPENTDAPVTYPACGLSYTHMRIHIVGRMVSALLLASLCVAFCLEILSHALQPHPIRHPLLATLVGAASLLHNLLVLGLEWRQRRRGYRTGPVIGKVKIKGQTKDHSKQGCAADPTDKSPSAVDSSFHNGALVVCNPATSCDFDTSSDSQSQSQKPPPPQQEVDLPIAVPRGFTPGPCHKPQTSCGDSDGLALESQGREVPGLFSGNLKVKIQSDQCIERSGPCCLPFLVPAIQALSSPVLALTNGLVLLLVIPEHLHRSWPCGLLVYLDPGFSLLAVMVLLVLALPQVYRCGLVLLQATPSQVCVSDLERRIVSVPGVQAVHELHIWQLTDTCTVASVHLHCHTEFQMHRCADLISRVMKVLQSEGVICCTVQPEFLISTLATRGSAHSKDDSPPIVHRDVPSLPTPPTCSLACKKACAGKMCCSPLDEDSEKPMAPSSGETEEEPQVLVIENTFL